MSLADRITAVVQAIGADVKEIRADLAAIDTGITQGDLDDALQTKADTGHQHTAAQITDSTPVGRSVLTATDAAAARAALEISEGPAASGPASIPFIFNTVGEARQEYVCTGLIPGEEFSLEWDINAGQNANYMVIFADDDFEYILDGLPTLDIVKLSAPIEYEAETIQPAGMTEYYMAGDAAGTPIHRIAVGQNGTKALVPAGATQLALSVGGGPVSGIYTLHLPDRADYYQY